MPVDDGLGALELVLVLVDVDVDMVHVAGQLLKESVLMGPNTAQYIHRRRDAFSVE